MSVPSYYYLMYYVRRFCTKLFPFDLTFTSRLGNQCLSPPAFVLYRIVILALAITNFILVEIYSHQADFLYFTFWGLILTLATFSWMTLETILAKFIRRPWTQKLWKVSHFMYTLTLAIQLFINGVFWLGMFPVAMIHLWGKVSAIDIFINICQHAVPLILLVIDLHMNYTILWNYAYTLFHTIFLFVYLGINMGYTLNHKQPVYPLITWKNLLSMVFIVACAIAIPLCHFLIIQYCRCAKKRVIKRIMDENQSLGSITPMVAPNSAFELGDQVMSQDTSKSTKQCQ